VAWRVARLRESGFRRQLAQELAPDGRYDLDELLGLVDRGCPPELAARILAPLDAERGPEDPRDCADGDREQKAT
jgi:hypothetical protein